MWQSCHKGVEVLEEKGYVGERKEGERELERDDLAGGKKDEKKSNATMKTPSIYALLKATLLSICTSTFISILVPDLPPQEKTNRFAYTILISSKILAR